MAAARPRASMNNRNLAHPISAVDRMRAVSFLKNLSSVNPGIQGYSEPLSSNYLTVANSANSNQFVPPPLPPRADTSRSMNRFSRHSGYNNMYPISDAERMRALNSLGNLSSINPGFQGHGMPLSSNYLTVANSANSNQFVPPPLPPRADTSRSMDRYSRHSGYNNLINPFSRGMYSPSMYSTGYGGGYRSPYNRYGMPHDSYNSFIQMAEESTRPAFESIESVVDIVSSISMMLESTYHAVHSSYSAIIGVVDQFARLRDHMAEVLSFLALLRGLKYLCLKVLYLLRLRKDNPSVEAAWNSAQSAAGSSNLSQFSKSENSAWPFFMFVGIVIGAPWLMFKLLAKSIQVNKSFDLNTWKGSNGKLSAVMAAYDFMSTRRGDVSFKTGELLYIAPKHFQVNIPKGWLLACNKDKKVGLIPSNYLKTTAAPKQAVQPGVSVSTIDMQSIPEEAQTHLPNPIPFNSDLRPIKTMPNPSTSKTIPNPVWNEIMPDPLRNETIPDPLRNETIPDPLRNETIPDPIRNETIPDPIRNETIPDPISEESGTTTTENKPI